MATPWTQLELGNVVEYCFGLGDNDGRSCKVVCASISGIAYDHYMEFPCFHCCSASFNNDYAIYSQHYAIEFSKSLYFCNFNNHDYLTLESAGIFGRDFADNILRPANDNHRCPPLYLNPGYILDIRFRITDAVFMRVLELLVDFNEDSDDVFNRVMADSFNEGSGSTTKPASASYVSELVKLRDDKLMDNSVWKVTEDHECSICLDVIDAPVSSLTLECSHEFHHQCILRWLAENSVCPLCRFQMPTQA